MEKGLQLIILILKNFQQLFKAVFTAIFCPCFVYSKKSKFLAFSALKKYIFHQTYKCFQYFFSTQITPMILTKLIFPKQKNINHNFSINLQSTNNIFSHFPDEKEFFALFLN
jgi:hypothetical protein